MSAPTETSTRFRFGAIIAASALLATIGMGLAPSQASESPAPAASPEASASPEATTTSEDDHATNPEFEPPESVDTYVGQSVQSRKNADGFPNADLVNFRWAVTQVNAESLNGLDVSVPLPMDEAPGLRSLTGNDNAATEVDGGVLYEFPDVNGNQTKRTLNLWPQERNLPVDVSAEFTLDGQKVDAADIIGEGGLVTATYTIINQTVANTEAEFENVAGEDDVEEVETSQAMVGISKQFIPQSWGQFDPGHGIFGADGRGNYQTQWITLAFLPFAEGGRASFGWSAVIPEGEGFIPKMVIEVSPLYVPTHTPEEEEETTESSNGVPKPNLDSATASVHSGVEGLVAGISSLADTIGEAGDITREGVQIAISQVKAAVADLCAPELLYCANPEPDVPISETISLLITQLNDLATALEQELLDPSDDPTPVDVTEIITTLEGVQGFLETQLTGKQQDLATLCVDGVPIDPSDPPGPAKPTDCAALTEEIAGLEETLGTVTTVITDLQGLQGAVPPELDDAAINAILGILNGDGTPEDPGVIASLEDVNQFIADLSVPLGDLSAGIDQIGAAIDAGGAILGDVGSSLDQISAGRAEISGGLGIASDEVSAYIANVVAVAQAAAAEGQDAAAEISAAANEVKAELAGLKLRMAESPLPYGGGLNTAYGPAGDADAVETASIALLPNNEPLDETEGIVHTRELFGAYQFMLDPADNNHNNTPIRIVLALILVAGAGFLGIWASKRAAA